MEESFGISEFLTPGPGFDCFLKQRYEDFIVNEIDLEGNVVHLTSKTGLVKAAKAEEKSEEDEEKKKEDRELLVSLIGEEKTEAIGKLTKTKGDKVLIDSTDKDKEWRKQIHHAIRAAVGESYASFKEGTNIAVILGDEPGRGNKDRKRGHWDSNKGDYCHFTLYKENKDLSQAIGVLAKMLRVHGKSIGVAGTKDRRAVTSQRASVFRIHANRLASLNQGLRGISLGDFCYKDKEIRLGDLQGNAFTVVLRDVKGTQSDLEKAIEHWKGTGFINYFGTQRFGTTSVPTWKIGKELVLQNWEGAVNLLMKERPEDEKELKECHRVWTLTKDPEIAIAQLSPGKRHTSIEGTVLTALKTQGAKNYINGLLALTRATRNLYVHSLQSYLWNRVVSKRIKEHGLKVLKGDLVYKEDSSEVMTLSEEGAKTRTIHEVLCPSPGSEIEFPDNDMKDWFVDEMAKEGISFSNFQSEYAKHFWMKGSYRNILIELKDVDYEFQFYTDVKIALASTDLRPVSPVVTVPDEGAERKMALITRFSLPPGSYATMALRELMKRDTSKQSQMAFAQDGFGSLQVSALSET